MKLHGNARTCAKSRALIARRVMDEGWSQLVEAIEALRRLWMTAAEIAEILGIALSTVSLWLKRIGLGKRSRLTPPEPPNRYERRNPGELVHVDIKKLGRISVRGAGHRMTGKRGPVKRTISGKRRGATGWEFVHVMVDEHSRLAYAEVLEGLSAESAVAFLGSAMAWFAERGVKIRAVMTDNGSCYLAHAHRAALRELGLKHLRIKPGRPRTNGKAERFIQTLLNEWAYARLYGSSAERTNPPVAQVMVRAANASRPDPHCSTHGFCTPSPPSG